MHTAGTWFIPGKTGQRPRAVQRTRVLAAGLLAGDGHSTALHCLIRDISPMGAQIRIGAAQPVPQRGYIIHLRTRFAYRARLLWRHGSLAGFSLGTACAIDDLLPARMEILRNQVMEAGLHHRDQLTSQCPGETAEGHGCGADDESCRPTQESSTS